MRPLPKNEQLPTLPKRAIVEPLSGATPQTAGVRCHDPCSVHCAAPLSKSSWNSTVCALAVGSARLASPAAPTTALSSLLMVDLLRAIALDERRWAATRGSAPGSPSSLSVWVQMERRRCAKVRGSSPTSSAAADELPWVGAAQQGFALPSNHFRAAVRLTLLGLRAAVGPSREDRDGHRVAERHRRATTHVAAEILAVHGLAGVDRVLRQVGVREEPRVGSAAIELGCRRAAGADRRRAPGRDLHAQGAALEGRVVDPR